MSEILIVGSPSLVVAAALELTGRGYVQTGPSADKNLTDPIFLHAIHGTKTFTEATVKVVEMEDVSPSYFKLPEDWDELIVELNSPVHDVHEEIHEETQTGINPFDPQGIVNVLDAETMSFLLACPKCGGYHNRHAGYFTSKSAYKNADERQGSTFTSNIPVHICVKCKTPLASIGGKVYDVSQYVDVKAWEKTEKEAHKATGPGGQC